MFFEGNKEVFANLFEKRRLLERGSAHQHIRPSLLILGGTMRGVYGGGQVTALEQFGLTTAFDHVVGISTGAPTAAYFVAGQARLGTTIYAEECATPAFISAHRLWRGAHVVDTDYLAAVFRGTRSTKPLDQKSIYTSRTGLHIGVTDADTGEGVLLNAKGVSPDVVEALKPSMSYPWLSPGPSTIGGRRYTDGAGALPFPVTEVMEAFDPTDLLILANRSRAWGERSSSAAALIRRILMQNLGRAARKVFATRNRRALVELRRIREHPPCRIALLWSDNAVQKLERDPQKLRAAAARAEKHLLQLLETAALSPTFT